MPESGPYGSERCSARQGSRLRATASRLAALTRPPFQSQRLGITSAQSADMRPKCDARPRCGKYARILTGVHRGIAPFLRAMLTICVMMATVMQALDTTIANV
jgi:hypothetical protein